MHWVSRLDVLIRRLVGRFSDAPKHPEGKFVPLYLERLEDRRVLSVSAALVAGELLVESDAASDDVTIQLIDAGTANESIQVLENGVVVPISTGGGPQDSILTTNLTEAQIRVLLGDGDDTLSLQIPTGSNLGGETLQILVDGQGGTDEVTLVDNGADPAAAQAVVNVTAETIRFGDGDFNLSTVDLQLQGQVDLDLDVTLTTAGDVLFDGDVVSQTGANLTILAGAGNQVSVTGQLGAVGGELGDVEIQAGGSISVGETHLTGSLTLTSGSIQLSEDLIADAFDLNGAIEIDGDVSLTSLTGNIDLAGSPITGANAGADGLSLHSGADVVLEGLSGIDLLEVDADGEIRLAGTLEANAMMFDGDVVLTDHTWLRTLAGSVDLSAAPVTSATPGVSSLRIVSADEVVLSEVQGLNLLSVQAAGLIFTTGNVSTVGSQNYRGAVQTSGNREFTSQNGSVVFHGPLSGALGTEDVTVTAGQNARFRGDISGLNNVTVDAANVTRFDGSVALAGSLETSAGGTTSLYQNVTTGGEQTYGNSVYLGGDVVMTAADADGDAVAIRFHSNVNDDASLATGSSLTVDVGLSHDVEFLGGVGSSRALDAVTITAARNVTFAKVIRTRGDVNQESGSGTTEFHGSVGTGVGGTLSVATDSVTFAGGTMTVVGNTVVTAQNAVEFGAGAELRSTAGTITLLVNQDGVGSEGFVQNATSRIRTQSESADAIRISVGGDGGAAIALLQAGTASGVISVTTGGAITDATVGSEAANLRAHAAALRAGAGIGGAGDDDLDVHLAEIAFDVFSGQVFIENTQSLTITNVDGLTESLAIEGGAVTAQGALRLEMDLTVGGDMSLIAANGTGDNSLVIDANLTHRDGDGVLSLIAGDGIELASGTIQNTGGAVNEVRLVADAEGALDATRGGITQTGGAIQAGALAVQSFESVLLTQSNDVDVLASEVTGDGASLTYVDQNGLTVGSVNGLSGISTTNGTVDLSIGETLFLGDGAGQGIVAGTGNVLLHASNGGVQTAVGSTISASQLRLTGAGAFQLGNDHDVDVIAANIAGDLTFHDVDDLEIGSVEGTDGIATGSGGGDGGHVTVSSAGELTVSSLVSTEGGDGGEISVHSSILNAALQAGAGDISLQGGGDDLVINVAQTSATTLTLTANCDVIINAIVATTDPDADLIITADQDLDGFGGVLINASGQLSSAGDVTVTGSDLCATVGAVDAIHVVSDGPNNQIEAAGNILLQTGTAAPLDADVIVDGKLASSAGGITVQAVHNVLFGADGDLTTQGGDLSIIADADGNDSGGVRMDAQTLFDSGVGRISIDAAEDIQLGGLISARSDADAVTLVSRTGAVTDGSDDFLNVSVVNGQLNIDAFAGIGSGNAIETNADRLSVVNRGSGHLELAEADDVLIRNAVNEGSGDVRLVTTNGSMTVVAGEGGVQTQGGAISLRANGAASDLLIEESLTSQGGEIDLAAGRDVRSTSGSHLVSSSTTGAAGNVYVSSLLQGVIELQGDIDASGAPGEDGGNVTLTTADGAIEIANINVSGGDDAGAAGNSGDVIVSAGDTDASTDSHLTLRGAITALGGAGGTPGADGTVDLSAEGNIIDGADGNTLIQTGNLRLSAREQIGEIDDFVARTGNAIDVLVRGELQQLSVSEAGGVIHVRTTGDLVAATGAIQPDADGPATVLLQADGDLDLGANPGAMVLTDGDRAGLHAGGVLTLPDAGLNVGDGELRLSGGTDVVDPAGRELGLLVADLLVFESGSAGGSTTLTTNVNELTADLSTAPDSADLIIQEQDSIFVRDAITSGGDLRISAALSAPGDLTIGQLNAGAGDVILDVTANGGQIKDGDETRTNILANGLAIRATDGISNDGPLEVQVNEFAATTQTGDIHLRNVTGDLTIGVVDGLNGATIANGGAGDDLTISTAGTLEVEQNVSNVGGNITLAADDAAGELNVAPGTVIAGTGTNSSVELLAGSHVNLGTGAQVQAVAGAINLMAGVLWNSGGTRTNGSSNASLRMQDQSKVASESGDIILRALGDVELSMVDADSDGVGARGNVLVTADDNGLADSASDGSGAIRNVLTTPDLNVVAETLTLQAATGIGSDEPLQLNVASVEAANSVSGNVQLVQAALGGDNPLVITGISNVAGNIDVRTIDGDLTIVGPVSTTQGGTITLVAGDEDLDGNGDLLVQSQVSSESGTIELVSEGNDVLFSAQGDVTSDSGDVVVSAGQTDGSGAIEQDADSVINAGSGRISLTAQGPITLGRLITLSEADDAVTLTATGEIRSADASLVNVLANGGRLVIDSGEGVSDLRTTVAELDLVNRNSGAVTLIETDAIDVIRAEQQAAEPLTLTSGGTMMLVESGSGVSATTGNVTLQATGASSDVVIDSQVATDSGEVLIIADRNVLFGSQGLVDTQGTLTRIYGGGDPSQPDTTTGGVFMEEGSLINLHNGDLDMRGETGIAVSRIVTTSAVRLTSTAGAISNAGSTGGPNIEADRLALDAATGIGNGTPLATRVALLAARNSTSGDLQIENDSGQLLTIGTFTDPVQGDLSGLLNAGSGNGEINVTNQGALSVMTPVANLSGGPVTLTAEANGGDDDHLTVASPIFVAGPGGHLTLNAGTDLILLDTPAANDLEATSITGIAARDVQYQDGFVVKSSTGSVTNPTPLLENVVTPQVLSTGIASIHGDFGRPGDNTFVFLITYDPEGPVEDEYDSGDQVVSAETGAVTIAPGTGPGSFSFDHRYFANPNEENPSAPIPITITLYDDRNITFIANGQDLGVVSVTSLAPVPGTGISGGFVFDLSIEPPAIETPRVVITGTMEQTDATIAEANQEFDQQSLIAVDVIRDERIVVIEKLTLDGELELDANGDPIRLLLTGEEADHVLNDLGGLHERLREGRWRISVQEGQDALPQLIQDVVLRNGKAAGDEAGTLDRPPTDGDGAPIQTEQDAAEGDDDSQRGVSTDSGMSDASGGSRPLPAAAGISRDESDDADALAGAGGAALAVWSAGAGRSVRRVGNLARLIGILLGCLR